MFPWKLVMVAALLAPLPARADTLIASWYGPGFEARPTASGCRFHSRELTAASPALPLGTILLVRRGERSVVVVINDRGPFVGKRGLDLSRGAAEALGMVASGVAPVRTEIIGYRALRCARSSKGT